MIIKMDMPIQESDMGSEATRVDVDAYCAYAQKRLRVDFPDAEVSVYPGAGFTRIVSDDETGSEEEDLDLSYVWEDFVRKYDRDDPDWETEVELPDA